MTLTFSFSLAWGLNPRISIKGHELIYRDYRGWDESHTEVEGEVFTGAPKLPAPRNTNASSALLCLGLLNKLMERQSETQNFFKIDYVIVQTLGEALSSFLQATKNVWSSAKVSNT